MARSAGLSQLSFAYAAWSWAVAASVLPLAEAEGAAEAEVLGVADGDGVESAFSASVTARPWVVAEAVGDAEEEDEAFSPEDALLDGLGEPLAPDDEALGEGLGVA